jgi:ribose transport system permease protein
MSATAQPPAALTGSGGVGAGPPRRRLWSRALARQELSALVVLVALLALFTALRPEAFATSGNLQNLAKDFSIILILSVGTTFVMVMGMFDLSIGSVLVFSQIVAVKVMGGMSQSSLATCVVGLLVALAAGAAWGGLNGFLVGRLGLSPFIVTLATLGAAVGAAQLISDGGDLTTVPPRLNEWFGIDKVAGIPVLVLVAAAVTAIAAVALSQTIFGRRTYVVGSNAEAARRASVRVTRHVISVYVLMGMLAGLAGYLSAARFGTTSIAGHTNDPLLAITAVALGGASLYGGSGTIIGTLIGVSIPAVLQNGLVILGTQPYWYQIIVAAALVFSIYVDRQRRQRQYR